MSDQPMKFASQTAKDVRKAYPGKEWWLVQYNAEPLLAVMREVISEEGQCRLCGEYVAGNYADGNKHGDVHADLPSGAPCPAPAALAAMELEQ